MDENTVVVNGGAGRIPVMKKPLNLDECCMDVEVNKVGADAYELWFVAIAGGHGPRVTMTRSILQKVKERAECALAEG
jgi:hypothetical protein